MSELTRHRGVLGATVAGVLDALGAGRGGVALSDDERLDGLTVLVTGASRGLGRAIARGAGRLGAHVHVAVRSLAEETVEDVLTAGAASCSAWPVDLERLDAVDALVDALADAGVRLDRVVLNAGVVPLASRNTPDGLDVMLQVNAVANVRLVDRLLARGVLAPSDPAPRVIVVGSESHRSAPRIVWDTLATPRSYGTAQVVAEYGRTKLVLHTWAVELARRLDAEGARVEVHHLCPGAIASEIAREAPAWSRPMLALVFRAFFQAPDTAARPVLWLLAARQLGVRTGRYLHMRRETEPAALASDPAEGAAAWAALHRIVDDIVGG